MSAKCASIVSSISSTSFCTEMMSDKRNLKKRRLSVREKQFMIYGYGGSYVVQGTNMLEDKCFPMRLSQFNCFPRSFRSSQGLLHRRHFPLRRRIGLWRCESGPARDSSTRGSYSNEKRSDATIAFAFAELISWDLKAPLKGFMYCVAIMHDVTECKILEYDTLQRRPHSL